MKKLICSFLFLFQFIMIQAQELRAPAYPLVVHDPYFSIWSFDDQINKAQTKHWTGRDHSLTGIIKVDGKVFQLIGGAPSQVKEVLPTAEKASYAVKYTDQKPAAGWEKPAFSDAQWKNGNTPFGDGGGSNPLKPKSSYTKEVWYRREFNLTNTNFDNLQLNISYDDDVEVYFNGVKAFSCGPCYELSYAKRPISAEALKALKPGNNIMAVHCVNSQGGAYIDAGLIEEQQLVKISPAIQNKVDLTATQTKYTLTAGQVNATITFTSPLLMDQLDVLTRPASYITFDVQSNDGKAHDVQLLFGASGVLSTNTPYQEVAMKKEVKDGLLIQSVGTVSQPILEKKGDDLRIDWGYAYVAAPQKNNITAIVTNTNGLIEAIQTGKTTQSVEAAMPAFNSFMGVSVNFDKVNSRKSEHVIVGYDDLLSVQYFGTNLKPWWRRKNNMNAHIMLAEAEKDYTKLMQQCEQFDKKLYQDALAAGGKEYADLCELAYRQAIAAHKVVAKEDGTLLFFSKENFSNGSIGTVDVTYPSAPLFILYNTELMKGMLRFIIEYSESGKWTKPFAAHDVGTYPLANGQTYGEDMPVEESGNMLVLVAAIAEKEKNANFAKDHWQTLTTWAEYLKKEGFDPANQLCTDDFAGHLARNANLSIKAILGLASYGKLAGMLGKKEVEQEYTALAKTMATKWVPLAKDGNHYTLAFESKGTWSQKYNLVWDKLLKLNIFPADIAQTEIAYYKTIQQPYGLPLDSRKTYTKSDWIIWTATLADKEEDFKTIIKPVWKFANETPDRIPLSDWHETTNAKHVGFRARSVVGGYFIKMLEKDFKK